MIRRFPVMVFHSLACPEEIGNNSACLTPFLMEADVVALGLGQRA